MKYLVSFGYYGDAVVSCERDDIEAMLCEAVKYDVGCTYDWGEVDDYYYGDLNDGSIRPDEYEDMYSYICEELGLIYIDG